MNITPLYTFISTGEKTMMYTLREMARVESVNSLGLKVTYTDTFYIQNLSTDKDTANEKAQAMSDAMGLEFRQNADFDLNAIKRLNALTSIKEMQDREAEMKNFIQAKINTFKAEVVKGFMACGKHLGKTAQQIVEEGDIDYVLYCASQYQAIDSNTGSWNINCAICSQWLSENPQPESDYIGVVGEVLEEKVTVKRVTVCNGRFYTVMYLCVTAEGNLIKFFTTAKAFNETKKGDEFFVKGKIKEHAKDHYVDGSPKVTMINRPKMGV